MTKAGGAKIGWSPTRVREDEPDFMQLALEMLSEQGKLQPLERPSMKRHLTTAVKSDDKA